MHESSTRSQCAPPPSPAPARENELWSDLSHEISSPINAIIGFAELLHDGKVGALDTAQRDCVGDILVSSRQLQALLEDLFVLARIEGGRLQPRNEPINPREFVAQISAERPRRLPQQAMPVRGLVADDLPEFDGDRVLLTQLLRLLLAQTTRLNRAGRTLALRIGRAGPAALQIDVLGDAVNAEAAQQRWAELAEPAPARPRRRRSGLFGLALAERLSTGLGGQLAPYAGDDGGAGFRLSLPWRYESPGAGEQV